MVSVPASAWEPKKKTGNPQKREDTATDELRENGSVEEREKKILTLDALAYYQAAVETKEQEHIPVIGPSLDRRMLRMMTKLLNSNTVQGLICIGCGNFAHSSEIGPTSLGAVDFKVQVVLPIIL